MGQASIGPILACEWAGEWVNGKGMGKLGKTLGKQKDHNTVLQIILAAANIC